MLGPGELDPTLQSRQAPSGADRECGEGGHGCEGHGFLHGNWRIDEDMTDVFQTLDRLMK
jgi:hypothetical protein